MRDDARLEDLGDGIFAWLQPDGSWGLANAGLVSDGGANFLVDTLYDLPLTQRMLDAMAEATPAARKIDTLVNTRERRSLLRQPAGWRRADHHVDGDGR